MGEVKAAIYLCNKIKRDKMVHFIVRTEQQILNRIGSYIQYDTVQWMWITDIDILLEISFTCSFCPEICNAYRFY